MSSSTKIDNRKKYILILGKGPTQGLEHTLTAEKMYSINLTSGTQNFVWSCIIMGQIIICLFGKEIHKFNTKDSEIVATQLCLGNISKDWSIDNMNKTGFYGSVYDFNVHYDYCSCWCCRHSQLFNEKEWHNIIKCLGLLEKRFLLD